ncbi:MAG: anti-sigma factor [Gordonia sp. (in: high G+C Gram-positive bacteria)]
MADDDVDDGDFSESGDLLDWALPVALDAVTELERRRVDRLRAEASDAERDQFDAAVAATRDSMAQISETTAEAPPEALRDAVARVPAGERPTSRSRPWNRRSLLVAAVAAVVVGVGGGVLGYNLADRQAPPPSTSDRVLAAGDARTVTGPVGPGRASVTYSLSQQAGVLVMNDVPQPAPGTVYQMWLIGPGAPRLAGVMTRDDVGPSTTAAVDDIGDATKLAFTVGDASRPDQLTSAPIAELPLAR